MANIQIDFSKEKGKVKPLHGVGQAPFSGINFEMFHYLTEAGIPYSRLHDVGGGFGGNLWADIPNIFRDFDADEYDERSYDFTFTDLLISALVEAGVEPYYRLGVTIENYAKVKSYRIDPPKDPKKWAVICEHVIRHYTEGWANGFHYHITYWEIWNEPENLRSPKENQMWTGTKEQYYELYEVASKHIKSCFPHLKVGGYASTGFYATLPPEEFAKKKESFQDRMRYCLEFFNGFLEHIQKTNSPLDFFSWHSYDSVEDTRRYARYVRERLDNAGYTETETSLNEWNVKVHDRGLPRHAANTLAMMLMLQDEGVDNAMFYDARLGLSVYGSMFHPMEKRPYPTYYAFTAFNRLFTAGTEVETVVRGERLYAVSAKGADGAWLVISNNSDEDVPLNIETEGSIRECFITTEGKDDAPYTFESVIPKQSILSIAIDL